MDVRSKNQPVRGVFSFVSPKQQQTRARRGREKGLCGRTDCHEKERYPFVPRILHIRERRTTTLVHHCHISHHPANGESTFRQTRGSARSGRRRRRRGAKAKLIWRGRWWWVVRGKRAHDGRAESPLNEREGEPGLCAESAGVRAMQEIREYEAGQLEEPRDEGGEHEYEDRAGGQLVDDHVAVHVQPRRGVHDGFPVGGRCICRRRHVGLETATTERSQKQTRLAEKTADEFLPFGRGQKGGENENVRGALPVASPLGRYGCPRSRPVSIWAAWVSPSRSRRRHRCQCPHPLDRYRQERVDTTAEKMHRTSC